MKPKIHPTYYENAKVTCACGNTWETGSTQKEIHTEICSACHPFYTGKQKLVDSARRVEKFQERASKKDESSKGKLGKKLKRETRNSKRKSISDKPKKLEIKGTRKDNKVNTVVNKVDKKKLESKTEK